MDGLLQCFGKTPMETFELSIPLAKEKLLEKLKEGDIFESYKQEKTTGELFFSEQEKGYLNSQSDNQ